ncbi:hypothetical protein FDP41_008510 [Naegleria fowleri]|uniref:Uncharacterized protein n=1 Tax=Naegleria fowleri TaxID=5763 RepID=A0A6A5B2D8_NAEFO|nr:uncharacterized protein FDP41_008510 [Naegleria fowleri]KAF0973303.1 hypothetical protein FDP41_008510 [Naegleria fowleri]CAG4714867.1 unnamed protein product [Naegleria fowleri]
MSSLLKNIAFHPFHLGNHQSNNSNNNINTNSTTPNTTTTSDKTTSPVRKNSISTTNKPLDEGQASGLEISSSNTAKHLRLGSGVTQNALINENNLTQFQHSSSLSMPKQQEDQDMKKKLKILKKEYLKQKAEMERLAQIALGQQEEIKHKDFQLKKYKQQCEEQSSKISELETQLQIERELCEGAIRMKKQTSSNDNNNQSTNTQQTENDLSLLLDEGLTTKDVMEKTYQYLKDDTFTFMLNTEEYQEEETISSLKQEIAALREENFYLREEKHKLNNEKVHLFELVHQLTQQLGLGNEDKN